MKTIIFCLLLFFLLISRVLPQVDPIQKAEILIKNSTNHIVLVKIFPVSAVYSGFWRTSNDSTYFRKYSLIHSNQSATPFWPKNPFDSLKYIVGGKKSVQSNSYAVVDFDDGDYFDDFENGDKVIGGVSYGLWKFEFFYTPDAQAEEENVDLIAECFIDYRDINHGQYFYTNDIYFNLVRKQSAGNDSLLFNWKSGDTLNIFDSRIYNKIIKSWHKVGMPGDPFIPGSPNAGLFKTLLFKFPNFPIDATQYGAVAHINPEDFGMNLEIDSNGTNIINNKSLHFRNTFITLNSGKDFTIGDSSKLIFEGTGSFLKVKPNSIIRFGENAGIEFINGASLIADGANFTSLDSNSVWDGIMLNNSGVDTIINCTFSKAKTALEIVSNTTTSFVNRVIKNNTFNVPPGGDYRGIYGENNFRITISDNVFNMPVNLSYGNFGIYLKSNITGAIESLPEENETPLSPYSIYVINNTFNNGAVSLLLTNYTSSYLPVFVKNNVFNNASVIAILGRDITGTIRDNRIMNFNTPMGIHIINSSPALYNNTVNTGNVSLHTIGSSYPDLSPFVYEGNKTWKAGRNKLSSLYSDDIQLVNAGNVYVNNGENKFTVSDTSFNYHIYGKVDTNVFKLKGLNNCWTPGNNARIYLRRNYANDPIMYETGVNIDCETVYEAEGMEVYYLGNGMYDTASVSPDTSNSNLTEEELLYNQGQNYIANSMFIEGISALKNLTDNYPYFYDLPASVYDLYSCYEFLDTTSLQSYRNTLYGNLKIYLEDKIGYGDYDAGFLSNAYNITLMCDVNMGEYDDAANGYEFISLFHPDPDIRLNASWDYGEVEAMMGGGSGERDLEFGISDLEFEKNKEVKETSRIEKLATTDPVMRKIKESFEKTSKDRKERTENQFKENSSSNEHGKEYSTKPELLTKENESDKFKSDKAKRNIFELKNLNKQDLEKRRIEDMLLSAKDIRNEKDKTQTLSVPLDYKLYQNYPNPFNPSTKINYSIPESGIVTIKIYDILGKEIQTLVNELKQAGSYEAEFYGKDMSSGVYFVRMESGDFRDIKRMVLIK